MKCRAYELEKGFIIEMFGSRYIVSNVSDQHFTCRELYNSDLYTDKQNRPVYIGRKSQMWVRLLGVNEPKTKVVKVRVYKDGTHYNDYPSLSEASRCTGAGLTSISNCINGRAKTANGFSFNPI